MRQKKYKIHDHKWLFRIVSAEEMMLQCGEEEDVAGLTIVDDKVVFIREDCVQYVVIAHELFHVYFHYLHLNDTKDIELPQVEEIMAEFIAHNGDLLVRKARKITRDLQKLQAEGDKNVPG